MPYWVLKQARGARFADWFWRNREVPEGTNKIDKNTTTIRRGHRIFYWDPDPKGHIVGLGRIASRPYIRRGRLEMDVKILTDEFPLPLSIDQLRQVRPLADRSFLKSGAGGTFFPLLQHQAVMIYQLCILGSPDYKGIWEDIPQTSAVSRKLWHRIHSR